MRDATAITTELLASGLNQPQTALLMELVLVLSSGNSTRQPVESPAMQAAERRRAWDRERKRAAKNRSVNSTGIPPELSGIPPDSAEIPCDLKGSKEDLQKEVLEKKESKKGKRLEPRASLSEHDREFALSTGIPPERIDAEWSEFVDYWIGVPGSRGCKLDWPATWRNRVRTIAGKYKGHLAKPLTEHQRKQRETKEILNALDNFATGSGLGGTADFGLIRHDPGDESTSFRGGSSGDVIDLPASSYRARG